MTQTEEAAVKDALSRGRGPRGRRRARIARWCAGLLVVPLALLVVAVILIINRPLPAPAWVIETIESRADAVLAGGSLSVGEISITLGGDLHPRVRITNARIADAAGAPLARIPQIEGLFSPRGLILRREALMQELRISGAQVNLRRAKDGAVAMSFQSGGTDVEEAATFLDLLDQSDSIFDQPALAALEIVQADGLIINYTDSRIGRAWTVDGGSLRLDVRGGTTRLDGEFAVLTGGAEITTLSATYESLRGTSEASLSAVVGNVRAADIAAQSAALSWLSGVDAPLSATLTTGRAADGALLPLTATLSLGGGALQPSAATRPIAFEGADITLGYDPAANIVRFSDIRIDGELGTIRGEGQALLGAITNGLPGSLVGQFRLADNQLHLQGVEESIAIPQMQADLKVDLAPFAITLGAVHAQLASFDIHGSGAVAATDAGWDGGFDLQIEQADQDALMALWPQEMLKPVRDWAAGAITAGTYKDVHIGIRKPATAPLQVSGTFGFTDMELIYLQTMPPISKGRGTGTFTQDIFAIALDEGGVMAPTDEWVTLDASTMIIPDLHVPFRPATYDLHVTGTTTALLSLLDLPPMGYMTRARIPVDVTTGTAQARMTLSHPMKRRMTGAEVGFSASATLRDVDSSLLIPNRRLQAEELALNVEKSGMDITGRATVDGVPITATYTHQFRGEGGGRLQGEARINATRLETFGVNLPPGTIRGEGDITLDLSFPREGPPRYDITSDLVGLQVAIPAVGWAKPPPVAGSLALSGRLGPAPQVEALAIAGGGLNVRGDVTFSEGGGLGRARLTQVQIGNWLNAPITLRGRGTGLPPAVIIGGGVIDLRRASFGRGGGTQGGPISIALDRLQVTEGIALSDFAGEFTSTGGFSGQFDALINNAGRIQGTVAPRNGRSAVRIVSSDAGAVAASTGLTRNAVGGALDLTLLPTGGDGTFDGQLAIRDLRIKDAPTIAALLDAISVVGLLQQLDGQGLVFDAVDARFRLTPSQVIVTESSAVGPGLGISLDGIYTLASQQLDFQGVMSPLYLINSIGSIFTRQGEGLIGFNFNIRGTAAQPAVSVNPLSAFTPGMFREIFRRNPPRVSQ